MQKYTYQDLAKSQVKMFKAGKLWMTAAVSMLGVGLYLTTSDTVSADGANDTKATASTTEATSTETTTIGGPAANTAKAAPATPAAASSAATTAASATSASATATSASATSATSTNAPTTGTTATATAGQTTTADAVAPAAKKAATQNIKTTGKKDSKALAAANGEGFSDKQALGNSSKFTSSKTLDGNGFKTHYYDAAGKVMLPLDTNILFNGDTNHYLEKQSDGTYQVNSVTSTSGKKTAGVKYFTANVNGMSTDSSSKDHVRTSFTLPNGVKAKVYAYDIKYDGHPAGLSYSVSLSGENMYNASKQKKAASADEVSEIWTTTYANVPLTFHYYEGDKLYTGVLTMTTNASTGNPDGNKDPKPDPKPDTKPDSKPDAKPDKKPDPKPTPKPDQKPGQQQAKPGTPTAKPGQPTTNPGTPTRPTTPSRTQANMSAAGRSRTAATGSRVANRRAGRTLPQTGESKAAGLSVAGAAVLATLGLVGFKRKEN